MLPAAGAGGIWEGAWAERVVRCHAVGSRGPSPAQPSEPQTRKWSRGADAHLWSSQVRGDLCLTPHPVQGVPSHPVGHGGH